MVSADSAGMVPVPNPSTRKPHFFKTVCRLEAIGSTAGRAGIRLANELVRKSLLMDGRTRAVLATGGDSNVGVTRESERVRMIERQRESGVYVTVLGFGTGTLKNAKMEQLADHGGGQYWYVDALLEARRVVADHIDTTLLARAKGVELQVEFNAAQVRAYWLVEYENRRLWNEEFHDAGKDGGDEGSGLIVTARYEVIPAGSGKPLPDLDSPPIPTNLQKRERRGRRRSANDEAALQAAEGAGESHAAAGRRQVRSRRSFRGTPLPRLRGVRCSPAGLRL